jgi:hypothetical protein
MPLVCNGYIPVVGLVPQKVWNSASKAVNLGICFGSEVGVVGVRATLPQEHPSGCQMAQASRSQRNYDDDVADEFKLKNQIKLNQYRCKDGHLGVSETDVLSSLATDWPSPDKSTAWC